jgi:hypothetical protein
LKTKIFSYTFKNALAYYHAGVVAVNSKIAGLAPTVSLLLRRVARFFLVQNTKTGKIYQITTNYTKCP